MGKYAVRIYDMTIDDVSDLVKRDKWPMLVGSYLLWMTLLKASKSNTWMELLAHGVS